MKAILITLAAGILVASFQQYRIVSLQKDNAELKAKVELQNHATENLAKDGQLETSQAAGRVANVLLEAEKVKRTLQKGSGPVAMNQFMQAVFQ